MMRQVLPVGSAPDGARTAGCGPRAVVTMRRSWRIGYAHSTPSSHSVSSCFWASLSRLDSVFETHTLSSVSTSVTFSFFGYPTRR